MIIVWWVSYKHFFGILFIIIEQQWHHPWSFQIWVMLCVIPYITTCKSCNCSSIFSIFVAYDIDFVFVILSFWILVFPQNFPKVPMVFTSSSLNFRINFQSFQIIPQHVPNSNKRKQHKEHHKIFASSSFLCYYGGTPLYIKA